MSKETRSQAQFGLIPAEASSKNNQIPIIAKGMCYEIIMLNVFFFFCIFLLNDASLILLERNLN